MTFGTDAFGLVADAFEGYFDTKGKNAFGEIFGWASRASTTYGGYLENNPVGRNDPFNRPEHEIQNWVKGIVWRDWYFRGKTLREIAQQEKTDSRYVARLIEQSLAVR